MANKKIFKKEISGEGLIFYSFKEGDLEINKINKKFKAFFPEVEINGSKYIISDKLGFKKRFKSLREAKSYVKDKKLKNTIKNLMN